MKRIVVAVVVLVAFAGLCWAPSAGPWDIEKELALYGYLNQNLIPGNQADVMCGPTAAVNSFEYLERQYPGVYGRSLIPDLNSNGLYEIGELIAVATLLGTGPYMNTWVLGTTPHDDFIWGKRAYIDQMAPGKTDYQAMDQWPWNNALRPRPVWVQNVFPTWDFLYDELVACEDVEILISWGSDPGHYVTLTSFHWTDTILNPGMIDPGEATIDFIDPATGVWSNTTKIWQSVAGGVLWTDYHSDSWISMAVTESIPEPATITLLLLGLGGAALLRRRKR